MHSTIIAIGPTVTGKPQLHAFVISWSRSIDLVSGVSRLRLYCMKGDTWDRRFTAAGPRFSNSLPSPRRSRRIRTTIENRFIPTV